MGLEAATYISDLVSTNPVVGDQVSVGDDHIRLIKAAIKATFPNINGAVSATDEELSLLAGLTAAQIDSPSRPGGRLTLTTALPVTTADVTGAATVYYTPYQTDRIQLWNGTYWQTYQFTEVSQAVSDATKSPAAGAANTAYYTFGWMDGATFRNTRGPTWSVGGGSNQLPGTGAGSTELELFQGRLVNKYAITNGPAARFGLCTGGFFTDASTQVNDAGSGTGATPPKRYLWNMYNRVARHIRRNPTVDSYTYTTATIRQANNDTANQFEVFMGRIEDAVFANLNVAQVTGAGSYYCGIGVNSAAIMATGFVNSALFTGGAGAPLSASWSGYQLGQFSVVWLERGDGANATTVYGDAGTPTYLQSGLSGMVMA